VASSRDLEQYRCVDKLDHAILRELSRDGRLTNVELADRVGLTPAPCLRRVRRLEESGVITGYRAVVDPRALGRGLEVMVNVDLALKDVATVTGFEEYVSGLDEVVEFRRMFGLPDYFLRVTIADLDGYERFVTRRLHQAPGIAKIDSHLTMKAIKQADVARP
jgi:DNA-binding Lrp family transcriptional regulator